MQQVRDMRGVGDERVARIKVKHPALSARWLRDAVVAHRVAFEQEMRRERRLFLDRRLNAYWKEIGARQA
jgi:hypothetical protein